jgi:hypothetical protein
MNTDELIRQDLLKPAFPDIIWNRPVTKSQMGNLLIIGGNIHELAAPALAYEVAGAVGAGELRVVLPSVVKPVVGPLALPCHFVDSTPSGSFSGKAEREIKSFILSWANMTLLAGDFGRNSETTLLLENLCTGDHPLVIARDSLDYFMLHPHLLENRPNTIVVGSFAQIQKFTAKGLSEQHFLHHSMGVVNAAKVLSDFTSTHSIILVTKLDDDILVSVNGRTSATRTDSGVKIWRTKTATGLAVYGMQQGMTLESLTSGVYATWTKDALD